MKFKTDIIIDGSALAKLFKVELTANQSVGPGEIAWNPLDGTFDLGLLNGVKLQSGQELHFYGKATETISSGDAVMFAGVQGDHILIAKADRSVINGNPNYFIGIATQNFTVNEFGYVTSFGKVRELDTSSYTLGSVLYFDSESSTPGLLTSTMPNANQAKIEVAAVVSVHSNQGILMVRTHIMPMLNEIQDVDLTLSKTTPLNADNILIQDSEDQSIWKKLSWGNTKATLKTYFDSLYQKGSGTTNYVAKFTGTTSLENSQIFDNGTNVGIGTNTPGSKLNIVSSGNNILKLKGGTENNQGSSFYIERANSTSTLFAIGDASSILGGTPDLLSTIFSSVPLNFYINGSERIRITTSGNVGIGTTNPNYRAQIETTGADVFLTKNTSSTSFNRSYFYNNSNVGVQFLNFGSAYPFGTEFGVGQNGSVIQSNTTSIFAIGTSGAYPLVLGTSGTERMRITSSGKVGIGVSSPIHPLSVLGKIGGSIYGDSFVEFTGSGNTIVKANDDVVIGYSQNFAIKQNGSVGIGITTPNASAIVHLESTNQGFLPPRMGDTDMVNIPSPAQGLMVFNTDNNFVCVYDGSTWQRLAYA